MTNYLDIQKLMEELKYLTSIRRYEVIALLKAAKGNNDASTNEEYDKAKKLHIEVESRIKELEDAIKHISVT